MEILKETIELIEILDYVTIVFAFFAMIGTFINFFYRRKDSKLIKIYIQFPDGSRRLVPYHITRRNFTRSELLGFCEQSIIMKILISSIHIRQNFLMMFCRCKRVRVMRLL